MNVEEVVREVEELVNPKEARVLYASLVFGGAAVASALSWASGGLEAAAPSAFVCLALAIRAWLARRRRCREDARSIYCYARDGVCALNRRKDVAGLYAFCGPDWRRIASFGADDARALVKALERAGVDVSKFGVPSELLEAPEGNTACEGGETGAPLCTRE